jgi:hypothetical protein
VRTHDAIAFLRQSRRSGLPGGRRQLCVGVER